MAKEIKTVQHVGFPKLAPENMSIHMLISEISKISHNIVRQSSNTEYMSTGFRHIIFHLAHSDGITQLELSKLVHLSPPTVSVTLKKMEEEGFVLRKSDETDMRQTKVFLSEKGRAVDENIRKSFNSINEQTVKGLSEKEMQTLKELLVKVRKNFERGE